MKDRDFKGVWIPKEIIDIKGINWIDKCFLSLIQSGYTELQTEHILKLGNISESAIHKSKQKLKDKSLYKPLRFMKPKDAKNFTIQNSNKGQICEWCHNECYILHEHHYPIPRYMGGKNVVRICPNCHCTFHSIFVED